MKRKPTNSRKKGRPSAADRGRIITEREDQVMKELKKGDQYWQIAVTLNIAEDTVKKHAHHAYQKLEVRNRYQAVIKYFPPNDPNSNTNDPV